MPDAGAMRNNVDLFGTFSQGHAQLVGNLRFSPHSSVSRDPCDQSDQKISSNEEPSVADRFGPPFEPVL